MTEWINVKDRLPRVSIPVLAATCGEVYIATLPGGEEYNEHWTICEEQCCSCVGCTGAITHWMPLPNPPDVPGIKPGNQGDVMILDENGKQIWVPISVKTGGNYHKYHENEDE